MTVKELNAFRHETFENAKNIPEIAEKLRFGNVYVFELSQLPDKHAVLVLNYKSQLNDNTMIEAGFDPAQTFVKKVMYLNRATKCAEF